jgi:hypothetical protein
MTDLSPNDLSHLSDAEFQSLCPQGEHAPGPEPLSPAAQAVLDAFLDCSVDAGNYYATRSNQIAAALRAASARMMRLGYDSVNSKYLEGIEASSDLLDQIATELENHS